MVHAPLAVIAERIGEGLGDFSRIGGTKRGWVCHSATLAGRARTDQELPSLGLSWLVISKQTPWYDVQQPCPGCGPESATVSRKPNHICMMPCCTMRFRRLRPTSFRH